MKLPQRFLDRMRDIVGDEYDEFLTSYDTQINKGIRINTIKCTGLDITEGLERVLWCRDGYYIKDGVISGNHPYHAAGAIYFQEPSAMAAAEAMPVGENWRILDLCAAPGGKTTHIGAKMNNTGLLVSNEIVQKRSQILAENTERMGLTNTIVTNESPSRLSEKFANFFDGIIVDAPCSGEGMFRKEPQAADEWSEAHTLSCAVRQKNILDDAYKMVKCGGYIVYSTCTFSIDENESVVRYMMDKYNMELCETENLSMLSSGIGEGMENCRRILPHKQKGEGHFVALLRRREENNFVPKQAKKQKRTDTALESAVKMYREFEKSTLNIHCEGEFVLFGDKLYMLPEAIDTDKLKIVRCGLFMGTVKNKRFEPSHALSHAFDISAYINREERDIKSDDIKRYMHGEVIEGESSGWCVISADGFVIGWGKGSGGVIKNHYPKSLRTM